MSELDRRVQIALYEAPHAPLERIAERLGMSLDDLHASMRRLSLREPDPQA